MSPKSPRSFTSFTREQRRRLRRWVGQPIARLGIAILAPLYVLYMRLVFATSRVRLGDFGRVGDVIEAHDGGVGLLWHEEVFCVPYAYPFANLRPHTLASVGRSGELITRILRRCGYTVFRGGTSERKGRRRVMVVREMVEHMQSHRKVAYGITVDGSNGPAYRMKPGGISIARMCGRPIMLVRVWCKRRLRLPTWDRTVIPLPFNEIRYYARGPYEVPAEATGGRPLRRFLLQLEDELIDLAIESRRDAGQKIPATLTRRTAEERAALLGASAD